MAVLPTEEKCGADRRLENRRALELYELSPAALEAIVERHDEREW